MSKHTPGPWHSNPPKAQNPSRVSVTACSGFVRIYEAHLSQETAANASLIASAPDLLNALRDVEWGGTERDEDGVEVHACPWCGCEKDMGHDSGCGLAKAIAKAEGGAS